MCWRPRKCQPPKVSRRPHFIIFSETIGRFTMIASTECATCVVFFHFTETSSVDKKRELQTRALFCIQGHVRTAGQPKIYICQLYNLTHSQKIGCLLKICRLLKNSLLFDLPVNKTSVTATKYFLIIWEIYLNFLSFMFEFHIFSFLIIFWTFNRNVSFLFENLFMP